MKCILKKWYLGAFWILSVLPFAYFFINFEHSPKFDWSYFNSLSFVMKEYLMQWKLPTIDLKICGGHDIAANPQVSMFSPLIIFKLLFSPYVGNVLSLIFMSLISFVFMIKILKKHQKNDVIASLTATLFNMSPFFSLHFAEGHIAFRSFYLLPFFYYLLVENFNRKNFCWAMLVGAFSVLDGGFYFLFFFTFFYLFHVLINYKEIKKYSIIFDKKILFFLFGIVLLALSKMYPLTLIYGGRTPPADSNIYSFNDVFQSLFNITLGVLDSFSNFPFRAHEYAHYITISLLVLFLVLVFSNKKTFFKSPFFIFMLFFLWIFLGIGGIINPYSILKEIPILNTVRIQSRFCIFFFFFFILFLNSQKGNTKLKIALLLIATLELFAQHLIVFNQLWSNNNVITSTKHTYQKASSLDSYQKYISKPEIYEKNAFSYICYEPSQKAILLKTLKLTSHQEKIKIDQLSMDSMSVSLNEKSTDAFLPQKIMLNYKYNAGWKCDTCEVNSYNGLIVLGHIQNKRQVVLTYNPFYKPFILFSFVFGLLISFFCLIKINKNY